MTSRSARRLGACALCAGAMALQGGVASAATPGHTVRAHNINGGAEGSPNVVNSSGQPVNEPRADVTGIVGGDDGTTVSLLAIVAQFTDPATDPAWQSKGSSATQSFPNTYLDWEIDTTKPGSDEFDVVLGAYQPIAGGASSGPAVVADVYDNVNNTVSSCATYTTNASSKQYQVTLPASCLGSPGFFRFLVQSSFDTVANDPNGASADSDLVPINAGAPVPGGEPDVTAGGTSIPAQGYWLFSADGEVFNHGAANWYGAPATDGSKLAAPIVSAVATADRKGYYLVGADGGVFAYGDAGFFGSEGGKKLNAPVISIIPTVTGKGYWLLAADGGVFTFGDAAFHGSTGDKHLNAPVLGGAATASGGGYWLVAKDGGIFSFGDAGFHGSTGDLKLAKPVVGMARSAGGAGYELVAADGGVFAFGDASYYGSAGQLKLHSPIVGIVPTSNGSGYRLAGADGGLFSYGSTEFDGSDVATGMGNFVAAASSADASS